eukprot:3927684-Rhodomonas_salina.1
MMVFYCIYYDSPGHWQPQGLSLAAAQAEATLHRDRRTEMPNPLALSGPSTPVPRDPGYRQPGAGK